MDGIMWLGDRGGGIVIPVLAPGLPVNVDEEVKLARVPIVPELKPKCDVDDDWWRCDGKWPGEPNWGLFPGEPKDKLDMLSIAPGDPGEETFTPDWRKMCVSFLISAFWNISKRLKKVIFFFSIKV